MRELLTSEEIRARDDVPPWAREAHGQYRQEILDPAFPCYFGTKAERQGHMRFAIIGDGENPDLASALTDFVAFSRANHRRRHVFIALLQERPAGFGDAQSRFWELLDWLHRHDPEPWPADVPADPDDPNWEFCFAGDPMFAFPCIPAYRNRRSRRMGDGFALCFQPRRIFFGVDRSDPGGERIRSDIYDRVRAWDGIPPHPDLEQLSYGDPDMREWKQYVLPDHNGELAARCPVMGGHAALAAPRGGEQTR
jgi:FPC/CPF motif-containing protein YcgG